MKKLRTIFTLTALFATYGASATIYNVNNDTPSPGEYTDLQLALDDAMAGDTLYLAPTLLSYGDIDIDKKINIMGPGYYVSGGVFGAHAVVGTIDLVDSLASGSSFVGFRFTELESNASQNSMTSIVLKRCIVDYRVYAGNDVWQNCVFEGNVFLDDGTDITGAVGNAFTNSTITNNIFNGYIYYVDISEVSNNIFLAPSGGGSPITSGTEGAYFANNIIIGRNVSSAGAGNTYTANISFNGNNNSFPNGTNFEGVDPMFVSNTTDYFDLVNDYHLDAGSPGIASGTGGDDLGVYDGAGVYRIDGEPNIPIIRQVNVPGGTTVPANATFTINIISEAHE